MTAAEKGWQPIEPKEEGETHGFSGQQAMLRSSADDVVDPALVTIVEQLPEEEKKEAHREIEISRKLTQEEEDKARALLEKQGAQVVLEAEMEQVWYDASQICAEIDHVSSVALASLAVCHSMQIRVRSLKTSQGTEFHWAVKIPGSLDDSERLEYEGVEGTWEDALARLNEKIAFLINVDLHNFKYKPVTKETPALMSIKKKRTSYRYDERPDGKHYPCTGSQVDFDEWTEINGHKNEDGSPILITVDVEGNTLNGDATGLTPEQARRVPSVENCAWCLSLPENGGYDLFKMAGEKWPPKKPA